MSQWECLSRQDGKAINNIKLIPFEVPSSQGETLYFDFDAMLENGSHVKGIVRGDDVLIWLLQKIDTKRAGPNQV